VTGHPVHLVGSTFETGLLECIDDGSEVFRLGGTGGKQYQQHCAGKQREQGAVQHGGLLSQVLSSGKALLAAQ
jgi:hypothetical protein